jgi:ABC-type transport system involved in cytochrome bd biosynthesis fused ATPase/permease subunit
VEVAPGTLTALVSAKGSESRAVVNRLGRFARSPATWGGARMDRTDLVQIRDRILVADNEAHLFAGPLRDAVAGRHERSDEVVSGAIDAAAAVDIVDSLPGGLDATIDPQGSNLSGGQRQRVRLARALLADAEVLLAVEPTSALDVHTEAVLAGRMRAVRSGRTTVVTTTSPILLNHADIVYYLVDGRVVASGSHADLLGAESGYRTLVARGETDDGDVPGLGVVRGAIT